MLGANSHQIIMTVDPSHPFQAPWPIPDVAIQQQLQAVYSSGEWGSYAGPFTQKLRDTLANIYTRKHVMLTCSGTISIELALRGIGVTVGDEVILAGYDFPGNFRCIEATGATPVLVDIARGTWSIRAEDLVAAHSEKTKAVIVSSLHGGMADIEAIMQWSRSVGVAVVEDICQAPAATRAGQLLGTFGDLAVMSFGGSKLLTAGRGGAVLCNDETLAQRINVFKERGNDAFALSELQACVLLPQFETLATRHSLRRNNVNAILETTALCTGITPLKINVEDSPAFYKLAWVLDDSQRRQDLLSYAQAKGIPLFAGFNGFVKRSERRCRKPVPLVHSTAAAEATVLLHHPVLLQGSNVIRKLAKELIDVFNH